MEAIAYVLLGCTLMNNKLTYLAIVFGMCTFSVSCNKPKEKPLPKPEELVLEVDTQPEDSWLRNKSFVYPEIDSFIKVHRVKDGEPKPFDIKKYAKEKNSTNENK